MNKINSAFYSAAMSIFLLSSCATVFTGSRQRIIFDSDVPKTRVSVNGFEKGFTPVKVKVRKGFYSKVITFEKEGYETKTFQIDPVFNGAYIVNVFFWPGFLIDAATGAMMKYDNSYYRVRMETEQIEKAERVD